MKETDDKLIQLNEEINRRKNLKIHLDHLEDLIQAKKEELRVLSSILEKEEKDVIDTENVSIYSIFSTILGTREQQLEKERQEYLHALMVYKGVEGKYKELVKEKKLLSKSLNGIYVLEREFDRLIAVKEELLKKMGNYPKEFVFLNDKISGYKIQIKEIESAVDKGNTAKRRLHRIIISLKQIEQWGFEGKSINSNAVQRKTKSTQKEIYAADVLLQKYEDKLYDISVHFNVNFKRQIKNLDAFLDRFVDSLITDWVVNNKIENSIHLVNNMIDNITKLIGSLEYQKKKVEKYLEEDTDLKGQLLLEQINKNKS